MDNQHGRCTDMTMTLSVGTMESDADEAMLDRQ